MANGSFAKVVIFVLVLIYVLSPIDAVPGPLDDLIVILLGIAAKKRYGNAEQ